MSNELLPAPNKDTLRAMKDAFGEEGGNLERADFAIYTLTEKLDADPAKLGFPAMLPIEIALKTAPLKDIFEAYGLTHSDYLKLKEDPVFLMAVKKAAEMAQKEGFSFRMKALMQAEELLKTSWTLIHSADTPASIKKDLILGTWRAAGVAESAEKPGAGQAFQININLG